MRGTKRHHRQARAIPVRASRGVRTRLRFGAPFGRLSHLAAVALSLLVLLSPDLTLAPTVASEPLVGSRPRDRVSDLVVPRRPAPIGADRRTAGGALLPLLPPLPEPAPAADYQAALDAARAAGAAWGITFAAVRDGEVVWTGSSGRTRDGAAPVTADMPLVIGSVTKTFVSAAVLQLVEEGGLSLDDPVRRHLPELSWLSPEITIRQLLDHTSGLADVFNDATRRGLEKEPAHPWSAAEIFATLHEPWYAPGEGWAYANTNYFLLGLVIERLAGQPLATELERRFIGPLGLSATRMLGTDGGEVLDPAWTTIFWASGSMVSSATDLARWGDALYTDGVLSAPTRAQMLATNHEDYGFGVQRIELPEGVAGYGHTGLLNTYTTLLVHLPEERVTMALLVNRSHVDLGGMLAADAPGSGRSLLDLARDADG
jgi:D-alanyl-D-alanine carboxypeptidase